jgi:hypothetical protein
MESKYFSFPLCIFSFFLVFAHDDAYHEIKTVTNQGSDGKESTSRKEQD